jgi:hypothetical protein
MAHFAELDNDNIVKQIIVIANENTSDEKGVEKEEIGIAFCKSLFGEDTKWVQTSYNATFRGIFAMEGDFYDEENDEFVCIAKGIQLNGLDPDFIDAEVVEPTKALEG